MKRTVFIGFLLVFAACTQSVKVVELVETPSPELAAIDSLMWQRPDSALAVLLDFAASPKADSLDVFDGHYTQLLASELLYKNYYKQSNRPDLLLAVSYFDSLTLTLNDSRHTPHRHRGLDPQSLTQNDIVFLDARAHYINGVGLYERDSVVEACKEYIKALEIMEGYFFENEYVGRKANFMAMAYTRLTELFSDLYLNKQAIFFGKRSLPYYENSNTMPWHLPWMLSEIGAHYSIIEELDSANYYYQQAMSHLPDTANQMFRDIVARQTFLSYMQGETPFVSLKQLREMLALSESEKEKMSRCLAIGEIFYHEQQYDSAWVYLDKVFHESDKTNSKKQAAEWLAEICRMQDRNFEIHEYAEFLMPFANKNENQGALKSQFTELCQKYEQGEHEALHQKRMKKLMKWGGLVLAMVALLASIMVVSYFLNKKQRIQLEAQKEETEEKLRKTIHKHIKELERKDIELNMAITEERQKAEYNLKAREIQHLAVLGKAKNTIEHLQEINKKLNEHETGTEHPKATIEEYDALMREGLCVNIRQRLKRADAYTSFDVKDYSSLALSSKELSELIRVIDRHCPDFSRKLKKEYPNLNSNDIQLCRLYLLNLKVLQVAILLATDYSSVRKRTNRLKEKIGSEEIHLQLKSTFFEAN